jgi:hypothetical protein
MLQNKVSWIIITLVLLFTSVVHAQQFQELERDLVRSYRAMQLAETEARANSLSPYFAKQLLEVLLKQGSFNYRFDSLGLFIKVVSSPDKKLRTFSYDENSGKTNRTMATVVQFMDPNSQVHTNIMAGNDVLYYEWHQLPVNGVMHYISFGKGSRNPSTHLKRINAFRLTAQGMVWVTGLFYWKPEYRDAILMQAARRKKIKLKYKDEKNMLVFRDFIQTDFDGLKFKKGKKIRLTLQDGLFQPK